MVILAPGLPTALMLASVSFVWSGRVTGWRQSSKTLPLRKPVQEQIPHDVGDVHTVNTTHRPLSFFSTQIQSLQVPETEGHPVSFISFLSQDFIDLLLGIHRSVTQVLV